MVYSCAFQWLQDNEDVVQVDKKGSDGYDVSCRGVGVAFVDRFDQVHVDPGFLAASPTATLQDIRAFCVKAVEAEKNKRNKNLGREVLVKINDLENTEDRE